MNLVSVRIVITLKLNEMNKLLILAPKPRRLYSVTSIIFTEPIENDPQTLTIPNSNKATTKKNFNSTCSNDLRPKTAFN